MSESLLSFIVPTYQPNPIVFDKALKALCEQSLKEWEAVFVLDGPHPDARKAIEKAFKKVPNRYKVVEIEHGGAQKARNAGLPYANGDLVVFFDSDCVIEPHTAKAWVEQFKKNPDIGFVYSGYKWLEEGHGPVESEPFDPWTLRVRNYISGCFPVRRHLVGLWNEDLESLQDWDFWLGVVERGGKGKFMPGFAFSTSYPTPNSISGKGCTPEAWLGRMDRVKAAHNIPIREVCVTSLHNRLDAIALAKAIDADYQDYPTDKPNHYKTVVQIGFSVQPREFERCASAWGPQHKKVLFWTAEDVEAVYDTCSKRALDAYALRLNLAAKQYVEDKKAYDLMKGCGFAVEILPLPVISKAEVAPLPAEPKFLIDISGHYSDLFNCIQKSIPDIKLEMAGGAKEISDYTGLICFHRDRLLRPGVKRMMAAGRQVLSNIQAPFAGFINDNNGDARFVKDFVSAIRSTVKKPQSMEQVKYWIDPKRVEKFAEVAK